MHICLVSPYELSLDGGVNKHIFYLAKHLRRMGDEVEVLGVASGPPPAEPGVTCLGGVMSIQGNESDNRIGIFTSPLGVRRFMKERKFDVLHVHEPFVPTIPYYAVWTSEAQAHICTFHRYSEREATLTRTTRRILSPFLDNFHRGIAVSTAAARYAEVAWTRPLSIIPNGVDTSFFTPAKNMPERREGPVRLLFVGQWTDKRKGLPVLLDAFARLKARKIDVTLDVVGQGDPRIPIPEVSEGVTFHGRVPEIELRRRLRECDIFVAPSTGQESFGIVLVEAMASGRPLVCSNIDGYRDVASPLGGRLVPPHDAAALAEALQELARDPGLRRAMGQHNRTESLKYDWAAVAEQIREEYQLALHAPATAPLRPRTARAYVQPAIDSERKVASRAAAP